MMPATLPLLCISFACGILLGKNVPLPTVVVAMTAALAAACSLYLITAKKRAAVPLLFLFLLFGMLCLSAAERQVHGPLHDVLGRDVTLLGAVREMDFYDESIVLILQTREVALQGQESLPLNARVRVSIYALPEGFLPEYGSRLQLQGRVDAPADRRNPGGFNYREYLESQGVGAVMSLRAADVAFLPGRDSHVALALIHRARARASRAITSFLPSPEASLAQGILLGERRQVETEIIAAYQALGIAHLLAVSGLHVGFVAAFALFLTGAIRKKRGGVNSHLPAVLMIVCYVFLTGGRPPVWRAALMFYLALTARQAGREHEGLQALCASALVLLFFRPYWLFSLSFQFSFLATAGIILLVPRLQRYFSQLPYLISVPLTVTLAAQLTILPLQAYHFGTMSLLAVPVNLLCVPLVGVGMVLGLAGTLAGMIFLPLAAPFYWAALPVLSVLVLVPQALASLPFATLHIYTVSPVFLVLYGVFLFLFAFRVPLLPLSGKKALSALLLVTLLVWVSLPATGSTVLEVSFLDVGQGLAMHIRTPAGRHLLIDAGGRPGFDTGEKIVLPYLRHRRVATLDMLILTHSHYDHYGGMATVARNLQVEHFISNGDSDDAEPFAELMQVLGEREVSMHVVEAGSRITLENGLWLDVLSPPERRFRHTGDDANNNSLVLRLAFHEFSLLITGDAETVAITWLVREQGDKIKSTVLQVPHHGSRGALSSAFLALLDAQAAVIPVGKNNFGHPHPQTIELLLNHGVSVYRTDWHGSVTVQSDGKNWHISPLVEGVPAIMENTGHFIIDSPVVDIIR